MIYNATIKHNVLKFTINQVYAQRIPWFGQIQGLDKPTNVFLFADSVGRQIGSPLYPPIDKASTLR